MHVLQDLSHSRYNKLLHCQEYRGSKTAYQMRDGQPSICRPKVVHFLVPKVLIAMTDCLFVGNHLLWHQGGRSGWKREGARIKTDLLSPCVVLGLYYCWIYNILMFWQYGEKQLGLEGCQCKEGEGQESGCHANDPQSEKYHMISATSFIYWARLHHAKQGNSQYDRTMSKEIISRQTATIDLNLLGTEDLHCVTSYYRPAASGNSLKEEENVSRTNEDRWLVWLNIHKLTTYR